MPRATAALPLLFTLLACKPEPGSTTGDESSTTAAPETFGGSSTGADASTAAPTTTTTTPTTDDATSVDPTGIEATSTGAAATTDAGTTGATDTGETGAVADCSAEIPHVLLSTTMGDMIVRLDRVHAPITVGNFLMYVESGFYADTIFHRVIDGFVIQGGGFTPALQQKPTEPPIPLEISPELKHVDGAIAMARTDDPNSATSQFYLCDGPQAFLDGNYAVFGAVVEGLDVLAAIAAVPTHDEGPYSDVPVRDVIVTAATCVAHD